MGTRNNWKDEELIDRYLGGDCSEEELRLFDERYRADPVFAGKVEEMRTVFDAVRNMKEEDRFRELISEVVEGKKREKTIVRRLYFGVGGTIAAAVSFVIFLAYAPLQIPVQTQEVRAVRNHHNAFGSESGDSIANDKKKVFSLFFEAQSYLAEGELQPAILKLEELSGVNGLRPYFREAVQWHLIVAHLKNGNADRAGLLLKEFKTPEEYYIPTIDRWKVTWQVRRKRLFG